ncbi:MAG: dephospho-CoA kinase [Lachnospiraceae bacterium]|nr:dephospho-CoA kinase [Lachnospiraceae bacterium]
MNITITGNLGSGKSSVAKILKEKGFEIVSTGNIFRQLAMEKGLSVEEFNKQVNEAASKGDRSVDKMIDDMTTKIGEERDMVVFDSRLAWSTRRPPSSTATTSKRRARPSVCTTSGTA